MGLEFVKNLKNYNIVLVDNDNNFYGVIKVLSCSLRLEVVEEFIKDIIINLSGSEEKFFMIFSEVISDMCGELEKKITKTQDYKCVVNFIYDNADTFNVDKVF